MTSFSPLDAHLEIEALLSTKSLAAVTSVALVI